MKFLVYLKTFKSTLLHLVGGSCASDSSMRKHCGLCSKCSNVPAEGTLETKRLEPNLIYQYSNVITLL